MNRTLSASGAHGYSAELGACGDLRAQSLAGRSLSDLDLRGARFDGANLEGASLLRAALRGADLRSACLYLAKFEASDLRGARFSSSKALLQGAQWSNALVDHGTVLPFSGKELAQKHVTVAPMVVVASNQ